MRSNQWKLYRNILSILQLKLAAVASGSLRYLQDAGIANGIRDIPVVMHLQSLLVKRKT